MDDPDYRSGDDVVLEFLEHRYGFTAEDFRERVTDAAVRLGLVTHNHVDSHAAGDLAAIAIHGCVDEPCSPLGRYLATRWSEIALRDGESLVYWLRKLVFRGAWLDHRVKSGMLEVRFEDRSGSFSYQLPSREEPLVEAARHPRWDAVRYAG